MNLEILPIKYTISLMPQVRVEKIEIRIVKAPLKKPFSSKFGYKENKSFLLVFLYSGDYIGFGECKAGDDPNFSYETTSTAWWVARNYIAPTIIDQSFHSPEDLLNMLQFISGHNMAIAAFEQALYDLIAKHQNKPLWAILGGTKRTISVGISIGNLSSPAKALAAAQNYIDLGYKRLKIKIDPKFDLKILESIRSEFPSILLSVDANSSFSLNDISLLSRYDEYNLSFIEQPLEDDDIINHSYLQKFLKTPICLDESITSYSKAFKAINCGAAKVINIKSGRVRGLSVAKRIHDLCKTHSIPVWCGGTLDLGIARAHNIHMSSLENFTIPGDTVGGSVFWNDDIIYPRLDPVEGRYFLNNLPGIGVEINHSYLKEITEKVEYFTK